jgi:hypothetical protein
LSWQAAHLHWTMIRWERKEPDCRCWEVIQHEVVSTYCPLDEQGGGCSLPQFHLILWPGNIIG